MRRLRPRNRRKQPLPRLYLWKNKNGRRKSRKNRNRKHRNRKNKSRKKHKNRSNRLRKRKMSSICRNLWNPGRRQRPKKRRKSRRLRNGNRLSHLLLPTGNIPPMSCWSSRPTIRRRRRTRSYPQTPRGWRTHSRASAWKRRRARRSADPRSHGTSSHWSPASSSPRSPICRTISLWRWGPAACASRRSRTRCPLWAWRCRTAS